MPNYCAELPSSSAWATISVTCSRIGYRPWERQHDADHRGTAATADKADVGVRHIDAGTIPDRFARGWHCLGLADSFRDGKPHSVQAFGTKLVVFAATSDGSLKVLDGYCRHMGGDLTQGEIKGDNVACPFHDWRWSGEGRCAEIPYAKRVPLRARTRAWTTLERNGQLFVWNDPEGNAPTPSRTSRGRGLRHRRVERLVLEHAGHRGQQLPRDHRQHGRHGPLLLHPLRVPDVLQEHLRRPRRHAVHELARPARHRQRRALLRRGQHAGVEASYFGPSYMINWLKNDFKGTEIESVLINCHYPIDKNSFVLQYGVMVKSPPGVDADDGRT